LGSDCAERNSGQVKSKNSAKIYLAARLNALLKFMISPQNWRELLRCLPMLERLHGMKFVRLEGNCLFLEARSFFGGSHRSQLQV
jgi:hypothetical protein